LSMQFVGYKGACANKATGTAIGRMGRRDARAERGTPLRTEPTCKGHPEDGERKGKIQATQRQTLLAAEAVGKNGNRMRIR
jgi:hypothetical protein